jgi:RNA polymerase primary sigma factor
MYHYSLNNIITRTLYEKGVIQNMTNEELCLMIQHCSDKKSYLDKLYQNNKGLIFKMANRYKELADFDDLCQEGYLGLAYASEQWKEGEATFSTYALYWIKCYMIKYLENNNNVVRLPSGTLAQIKQMKDITAKYYMSKGRKPTIKELAKAMKLKESQIKRIVEGALFLNMKSTAERISEQDDSLTLGDTIKDDNNNIENFEEAMQQAQLKTVLWGIVDSLDAKQSKLIHEKYEKRRDRQAIADDMGLSLAKLRTIETHAMREMRKSSNEKKLRPFYEQESRIFSLSLECSGYGYFSRTWTSSPERAVMIAESSF